MNEDNNNNNNEHGVTSGQIPIESPIAGDDIIARDDTNSASQVPKTVKTQTVASLIVLSIFAVGSFLFMMLKALPFMSTGFGAILTTFTLLFAMAYYPLLLVVFIAILFNIINLVRLRKMSVENRNLKILNWVGIIIGIIFAILPYITS